MIRLVGYREGNVRQGHWYRLIILAFLGVTPSLLATAVHKHIKVGDYGTIMARQEDAIQGAIVEKVALYPIEHKGSLKRIERNGLLIRYKDAVGTVLMCHGFMCDKYDQGILRRVFPRGRYNTMTFDFRAHGEKTQGQSCTLGKDEALDVIA